MIKEYFCHATIVIGSSQCGKTTFINALRERFRNRRRYLSINFDPSKKEELDMNIGTEFDYYLNNYGPKKALPEYMNHLLDRENLLQDIISGKNVKYLLFEMPSEIDVLYRVGALPRLINILQSVNCSICIAFLLDAQQVCDPFKFVGAYLYSMSKVAILNVPHINILTKCDLLNENEINCINQLCLNEDEKIVDYIPSVNPSLHRLTCETFSLINSSNFGRFLQFDISEKASILQIIEILDAQLGYIQNDTEEEEEFFDQRIEFFEKIPEEEYGEFNDGIPAEEVYEKANFEDDDLDDDDNAIFDDTVKNIEELGEPKESEESEQEKWEKMLNEFN